MLFMECDSRLQNKIWFMLSLVIHFVDVIEAQCPQMCRYKSAYIFMRVRSFRSIQYTVILCTTHTFPEMLFLIFGKMYFRSFWLSVPSHVSRMNYKWFHLSDVFQAFECHSFHFDFQAIQLVAHTQTNKMDWAERISFSRGQWSFQLFHLVEQCTARKCHEWITCER